MNIMLNDKKVSMRIINVGLRDPKKLGLDKCKFNGKDKVQLSMLTLEPLTLKELEPIYRLATENGIILNPVVTYTLDELEQHLFNFLVEEKLRWYIEKNTQCLFFTELIIRTFKKCGLDLEKEIQKVKDNQDFVNEYYNNYKKK